MVTAAALVVRARELPVLRASKRARTLPVCRPRATSAVRVPTTTDSITRRLRCEAHRHPSHHLSCPRRTQCPQAHGRDTALERTRTRSRLEAHRRHPSFVRMSHPCQALLPVTCRARSSSHRHHRPCGRSCTRTGRSGSASRRQRPPGRRPRAVRCHRLRPPSEVIGTRARWLGLRGPPRAPPLAVGRRAGAPPVAGRRARLSRQLAPACRRRAATSVTAQLHVVHAGCPLTAAVLEAVQTVSQSARLRLPDSRALGWQAVATVRA